MALLGDFISNLSKASGAKSDTDAMKSVLMHPELSKLDIPDEFIGSVMKGLLTKEVAKNDAEIRNHYFGQWANTADTVLNETLTQYDIDAETAHKIKSEDGIYKRFQKLTEAVKEAESKKASAKPSDKKEIEEKLNTLNSELQKAKADLVEKVASKEKELTEGFNSKLKDIELSRLLSTYEYGLGDLPKDVQITTAKLMLQKSLEDKKLSVVYDPEKSLLSLKTAEGLQAFNENHAQLTLNDFASKVFSENKLLKVSGQANGQSNTPANGQQQVVQTNGQKGNSNSFDAAMAESLAAFKS
jgi:hypothetical protein